MKYLFSKAALPNYLVWTITLLPSYLLKYQSAIKKGRLELSYIILEGLIWFTLVIFLTAGIQFCIDKFVKKDETLTFKILKFLGFLVIASVLFNLILWPIIDVVYMSIQGKEATEYGKVPTNIYNWFVWIVWYLIWSFMNLYREVKAEKIKNAELQANLKESQLNTLKGQINPHFMFNSLNNIRGLMLEDVDRARNMLTNLSETLRYSLTKSNVNSIALEDELEMVKNYVEISKIQFEDRLQFETDIDDDSLNKQIPPMIIQMLVENAMKHGISKLKKGGVVSLKTAIKNSQLQIKVSNSGTLQNNKTSTQLGLQNIKKRLELLYGKEATFHLNEIENQVVATIKIPLS